MEATKKVSAVFLALLVCLVSLSCFASSAYAAMPTCKVWGNTKVFTYGSISVSHKAGIESLSWGSGQNYVTGWAYVKTSQSLSANTIGACGYLYNGAGLLLNSSDVVWNQSGEKDFGVGAGAVRNIGGTYYAGGRAYISGTHVNYQACAYSPTTTCDLFDEDPLLDASSYSVNDSGMTYGSMVSADSVGCAPDLVGAVATNGQEGYILYEQWDDALDRSAEGEMNISIPVYDQGGSRQIGEFVLSDPLTV